MFEEFDPTICEVAATIGEGSNTGAAPANTSSSANKAASSTVTTPSSKSPMTGTNDVAKASAPTTNVTSINATMATALVITTAQHTDKDICHAGVARNIHYCTPTLFGHRRMRFPPK